MHRNAPPNVGHIGILRKSRIVVHSFPGFTVLEAEVLVRVPRLHPEGSLLSQESNFTSKRIGPPLPFPDLGHLHLRPRSFQRRLVVVVVVLVVRLLLGKHGPRPRLLLQATRPNFNISLLGPLVLSLDQRRPESHVKVAPRTRRVVELQPVRRLVHVDPLVVPVDVLDSVLPSSSMEPSQYTLEPLLLEGPEDAHATTDEFRVDGVRARVHRDNFS